jgi:SAM-dependent methyltransferase
MELEPRVKCLARRILPRWLVDRLDPVEARIGRAVAAFAARCGAGEVILDAGCGENRFRGLFPRQRLVGYDRGVGDPRWDYGRVDVRGDLQALALRDASADAALCVVTLEHVPDPAAALAELARVLKPGAELLLIVPFLWEIHQAPHDFFRFTRFGIERLLGGAGLAVDSLETLGGFFAVLARRSVSALAFFQGGWRWPLFVLLAPGLGLIAPLVLGGLDRLDRERAFTLGYEVRARKPARAVGAD